MAGTYNYPAEVERYADGRYAATIDRALLRLGKRVSVAGLAGGSLDRRRLSNPFASEFAGDSVLTE